MGISPRWESDARDTEKRARYTGSKPACERGFFPLDEMKIFSWLSCILVAVTAVVAEEARVPPTELQIETTFKPNPCPNQAKKGDRIHVHYVSR